MFFSRKSSHFLKCIYPSQLKSMLVRPPLNSWQRSSPRAYSPSTSGMQCQTTLMTLRMYSLRPPLTPSQNISSGTILLNWSQMLSLPTARSTHLHSKNRMSWMCSFRRTLSPGKYAPLSCQWLPQSSLLRRRTGSCT